MPSATNRDADNSAVVRQLPRLQLSGLRSGLVERKNEAGLSEEVRTFGGQFSLTSCITIYGICERGLVTNRSKDSTAVEGRLRAGNEALCCFGHRNSLAVPHQDQRQAK